MSTRLRFRGLVALPIILHENNEMNCSRREELSKNAKKAKEKNNE